MPRIKGNVNRKPGIFGQSTVKVRDENNNIDRDRINVVIQYNDANGDRYEQTFEARMKKDGSGVYFPQGATSNSKPVLVSENPNEPVDTEALEAERLARAEARKARKEWKDADRATRLSIRADLGLGTKGRIPADLQVKYDAAYNAWLKDNPAPANVNGDDDGNDGTED